jgi:hypothetical protein
MKFAGRYAAVLALAAGVVCALPSGAKALSLQHHHDTSRGIVAKARWETADGFITFSLSASTEAYSTDGVVDGSGSSSNSFYAEVLAGRYSRATNTWVGFYSGRIGPTDYSWDEIQGVLDVHATVPTSNFDNPPECDVQVVVRTDSPPLPNADRGPLRSVGASADPNQPAADLRIGSYGYGVRAGYSPRGVSLSHGVDYGDPSENPGPPDPASASGALCGWSETGQESHNATISQTGITDDYYNVSP